MPLSAKCKESLIQAVAFAGAGLIGLATQVPVRDFVDAALAMNELVGPDTLETVSGAVFREVADADRDVVAVSVRDILADSRISLRQAIEIEGQASGFDRRRFTGAPIAARAMAQGGGHLVGLSGTETDKVAATIATIYRTYLGSSGVIESLQGDAISAIFGLDARMCGIERQTAAILRSFALDGLLETGERPLPHRFGPDSWLLRPEYGVVPFHAARDPDVEALMKWADADGAGSVRLIHGRGGAGKTRLAAEAVKRLREEGWTSGFLSDLAADAPPTFLAALLEQDRTLVVVDYAETRRSQLEPLLAGLADKLSGKFRVLLLARSKAEWWDVLSRSSAPVQRLVASHATFMAVSPLSREASVRHEVFASAATSFARALGLQATTSRNAELSDDDFGLPLFVHMAAPATTRGRPLEAGDELLADTLDRERRFWDQGLEAVGLSPQVFAPLMAQGVAFITAIGGCRDERSLVRRLEHVPLARGLPAIQLRSVANLISSVYPMPGQLGALGPNLVGEQLVPTEFEREPALFADALKP